MRLDRGSTVRLSGAETEHIEHAYAVQSLKAGAPERILVSQEAVTIHLDLFLHSRNAREVNIYTSDGSGLGQTRAVSSEIHLPPQLQTPTNVLTAESTHVEHRRSIGR